MSRIVRWWLRTRAMALGAAVLGFVVILGPVAGAHTEMTGALPVPGDTVGGKLDRVVVEFLDELRVDEERTRLQLRGVDGRVHTSASEIAIEGNRITARIEPLTREGGHVVEFQVVSQDGDINQGSFAFVYDAEAEEIIFDADDGNLFILVGALLVMVALAGLVFGPRPGRR